MPVVNWGDVPTWVSAIAAIGALVAAIVAGRTAKRIFLLELARDKDATEEKKRSQATHISAWAKWTKTNVGHNLPMLIIRNASDLPVYDVQFDLVDQLNVVLSSEHQDVLAPSEQPVELALVISADRRAGLSEAKGQSLRVRLSFRDSSGTAWMRETDGSLYQVVSDASARERRPQRSQSGPVMLENKPDLVVPPVQEKSTVEVNLQDRPKQ